MKNMGLWLSILVTVVIITLKISSLAKAILLGLFALGLLFIKRGVFYYAAANRKAGSEDPAQWEQAWPLYRRAIKAGIPTAYTITAASMMLQRGDQHEGRQILESYLSSSKKRDTSLDAVAKTIISMAHWMDGNLKEAIESVKEVYESGVRDKNLFINFTTYLIEDGQLTRAQDLIDEAIGDGQSSPGLEENQGWIYMLQNRWEEAEEVLASLVERNPRFPEAYVHYAQVRIHFGEIAEATELFEYALKTRFSNTSAMREATITHFIERLRDSKSRLQMAREIDADVAAVSSGAKPKPLEGVFEETDAPHIEGFATRMIKPKVVAKPESTPKPKKKPTQEDRVPNTDLTEEDLKLIEELERS